jgi:hypothetical protein
MAGINGFVRGFHSVQQPFAHTMGSRKKTLALHCDKTTSQPAGNSERMWQKFWHSYTSGVANQVEENLPAIPCAGLAAAIPCAAGLAAAAGLGVSQCFCSLTLD